MKIKKVILLAGWMIIFLFVPLRYSLAYPQITIGSQLPSYSDTEFSKSKIRIEVFGREDCPYCQLLQEKLYPAIETTFGFETIAIRYLNINHPQVKNYLLRFEEQLGLEENLHGAIPTTIINGSYLVLGYNKQSTRFFLDLIQKIQNDEIIESNIEQHLYVMDDSMTQAQTVQYFPITISLVPMMIGLGSLILLTTIFYYVRVQFQKKSSS